jgi:hypothetical protein
LRALYKKLRPIALTHGQRVHRHAIARDIFECHCAARALYERVAK